jgi:hypothetical protein
MTTLNPETFKTEVLEAGETVFVLFGGFDPETARIQALLREAGVTWRFCDTDSSDGAQVAMRVGIRQSPLVQRYSAGFVSAEYTPAGILTAGVFCG